MAERQLSTIRLKTANNQISVYKKSQISQVVIYYLFFRYHLVVNKDYQNWKKRSERRKHCALAAVRRGQKNFAPPQTLFGAGRSKFNQLQKVTTFIYRPSLVKVDARNIELSW